MKNDTIKLYYGAIDVPFYCWATCQSCEANAIAFFSGGRGECTIQTIADECPRCHLIAVVFTSYIIPAN